LCFIFRAIIQYISELRQSRPTNRLSIALDYSQQMHKTNYPDAVSETSEQLTNKQTYTQVHRPACLSSASAQSVFQIVTIACAGQNGTKIIYQWNCSEMMMFFWVLEPCRLVGCCQHIGEKYCLHLKPWRWRQYIPPKRWHLPTSLHGSKTHKKIIIILTAMKSTNITKCNKFYKITFYEMFFSGYSTVSIYLSVVYLTTLSVAQTNQYSVKWCNDQWKMNFKDIDGSGRE
jgi:hypothetical protein